VEITVNNGSPFMVTSPRGAGSELNIRIRMTLQGTLMTLPVG
jgi:hypothetical protein